MFSKYIDLRDARLILEGIVSRFGDDHTAQSEGASTCTYAEKVDGELRPVCLIGQMFADWGLLGLLVATDPTTSDPAMLDACIPGGGVWEAAEKVGITVSDEAQSFFRHAQAGQDSDLTWRRALDYAVDYYLYEQRERALATLGKHSNEVPPQADDYRVPEPLADWEKELLGK